jgi:hypothetical protein
MTLVSLLRKWLVQPSQAGPRWYARGLLSCQPLYRMSRQYGDGIRCYSVPFALLSALLRMRQAAVIAGVGDRSGRSVRGDALRGH